MDSSMEEPSATAAAGASIQQSPSVQDDLNALLGQAQSLASLADVTAAVDPEEAARVAPVSTSDSMPGVTASSSSEQQQQGGNNEEIVVDAAVSGNPVSADAQQSDLTVAPQEQQAQPIPADATGSTQAAAAVASDDTSAGLQSLADSSMNLDPSTVASSLEQTSYGISTDPSSLAASSVPSTTLATSTTAPESNGNSQSIAPPTLAQPSASESTSGADVSTSALVKSPSVDVAGLPTASQESTPLPSFANSPVPAAASLAPTTSTTSPSKPSPLASSQTSAPQAGPSTFIDPNVAKASAAQLLARKQNTSGNLLTRIAKLRQRIEKNRFDGEAWVELIQDALNKGDLEKSRETFEGFLKCFPDNSREWIAYADLELSHGNNDRVNEIFGRCLRSSPSVPLWQFYLTYIRRTNPIDRSSPERALPARDVITKAFEFSLAHIGADIEAGSIWFDYIEFLKEAEVAGTWEAQQKMDKLRQTYQRAVCIPLSNIELIWRDYDGFENNLNRATAKKFLQDRSPAYMTARAAARQLQEYYGRLGKPNVPYRPNWNSTVDRSQIETWRAIVAYETGDPLELTDPAAIRTRVLLTYRKAIAHLRFYPEIWWMAATYAKKADKPDDAVSFWRAGMEANATSLLIHYGYIENEESKSNHEECHKVYNGLIDRLTTQIDNLNAQAQQEVTDALEEKAKIEAQEKQAKFQNGMMVDENAEDTSDHARAQERESIKKAILDSKAEQIDDLKRLGANVWIMHMRFARRAEGIKAARAVFSSSRKWPHITWQPFEASAMLELHWNKEPKIATNVFEVGLKRFGDEVGYVVRYLDFLITVNDDGNARAVFERTIAKIPAEKAKPLWRRWAEYEYRFGDLTAIQKLDERLAEVYPEEPIINRFTERHSYLDLDDISFHELGQDDDDKAGLPRPQVNALGPAPVPSNMAIQQQMPQMGQQIPMPPQNMLPPQQQQPPMGMQPPPMQQQPPQQDPWQRIRDLSPRRGPPSIDGDDRRRDSRGGNMGPNKRRRSPSPVRGRRTGGTAARGNSPPRVSRHTPPDNFPEAVPWLMSLLPSKTVFAAHGPILDPAGVFHFIQTTVLPPMPGGAAPMGGARQPRGRSRSPDRRGNNGGRRRSPDYQRRY